MTTVDGQVLTDPGVMLDEPPVPCPACGSHAATDFYDGGRLAAEQRPAPRVVGLAHVPFPP